MIMKPFTIENNPKIDSGFTVPENYFENFTEKINQKLDLNSSPVIALHQTKNKSKFVWFKIAASIALLISGIFIFTMQKHNKDSYTAEVESYLTNRNVYSEDELVDLLDVDAISRIKINSKLTSKDLEESLTETADLEQILIN